MDSNIPYQTIDLHFQGFTKNIGCFLVPVHRVGGRQKWIMFESGPYSCHETLLQELKKLEISLSDIEKVFITHIHLDHSGGVWALAATGATVYVHPIGAPHLVNPDKLLESATRIYQDKMESLWSTIRGIEENKVIAVEDGATIDVGNHVVTAHHTPGHASHHIAWEIGDCLFVGDVCGIRIDNQCMEIPAPPPDYHVGQWLDSIKKIRQLHRENRLKEVVLTHFGGYRDLDNLLDQVENRIWTVTAWFRGQFKKGRTMDDLKIIQDDFNKFLLQDYQQNGLSPSEIDAYLNINPPGMTVTGILRYLKKYES